MDFDFRLIKQIIHKHFGLDITQDKIIKELKGNTHIVYVINVKNSLYVLRIATKEKPKLYTELWALGMFPKWGIPGPKLIAFDDSKKIIPHKYSIITFVEGEHPKPSKKAFESLSKLGLVKAHKKSIPGFGDINEKGEGKYSSWQEFLDFKFNKAHPNLAKYKLVSKTSLITTLKIHEKMKKQIVLSEGKLNLGDLHVWNFFMKSNKFFSFIDYKSILSGDPLWDYALIYYYHSILVWPSYIRKTAENKKIFYYYCMIISQNKLWLTYRTKKDLSYAKLKLKECIDEF